MTQLLRDPNGPLFRILGDLKKTTDHVEVITRDVRTGKGTVGALLKSDELLNGVRANLTKAGNILDHVAEASAKIPARMDQVETILAQVERASTQAAPTMDQVQGNLETFKRAGEEVVDSIT